MKLSSRFADSLYNRRLQLKLTQKTMSELCNISLRHYQDWEIGRSLPNLANALYISIAADISLDALAECVELNQNSKMILKRLEKEGKA